MKTTYEIACEIYEKGGQSAVFDYALKSHLDLPWNYCGPCESESPIYDNACLVCGSDNK